MRDAQHRLDGRHERMRLKVAAVRRWKGEDEDAAAHRHPDHPQRSAAFCLRLELHAPAGNHNGEHDREDHSDWPCQCPACRKKARPPYRDEIRHTPKQKVPAPVLGAPAPLAHHRLNQSDALADLLLVHRTSAHCVSIHIHRLLLLSLHNHCATGFVTVFFISRQASPPRRKRPYHSTDCFRLRDHVGMSQAGKNRDRDVRTLRSKDLAEFLREKEFVCAADEDQHRPGYSSNVRFVVRMRVRSSSASGTNTSRSPIRCSGEPQRQAPADRRAHEDRRS